MVHGFCVGLMLDSAVMDLGRFYGTEGLSGGVLPEQILDLLFVQFWSTLDSPEQN